ncbi:MAG: ATP-dependent helicase HrpB, partial [Deltaproteobacteria bacterium]|nr:ATP-dependent helicase HrpB [Deltaproteobacteria bacterium]
LKSETGSILVFLPGEGEIRRTASLLEPERSAPAIEIVPLYGNLSRAAQDQAIVPAPAGRRKVVLASAIAETSLTIEGIRIVIDGGLMRVPRFDARSAMTRLETVAVTRASADQRRGRAGRTAPGVCFRLWSEAAHAGLNPHSSPEIRSVDLAGLVLELALWGETDPGRLAWLDPPPEGALAQARELLTRLGALDRRGLVTPHGRRMAEFALHPRLAHMVLKGAAEGLGETACLLAALLNERDILSFARDAYDADLGLRLEALLPTRPADDLSRSVYRMNAATERAVRQHAGQLRKKCNVRAGSVTIGAAGRLTALAYPDRIAFQRAGGRGYLLANGRGACFRDVEPLAAQEFLAVADLDGGRQNARIFLAAAYSREDLEAQFADSIVQEESVCWERESRSVVARRRWMFGSLVLENLPLRKPSPERVATALLEGIRQEGLGALPWTRDLRVWQSRVMFLQQELPEAAWPDLSDDCLLVSLDRWLLPYLDGVKRFEQFKKIDLSSALFALLDWRRRKQLDDLAPTHISVPSGSRIRLDYSGADGPVLAVRLQELFGLQETPRVAGGRVPLLIHLLSPAGRPVQVTRDLKSFWQTTYFEVKKDLMARYPKHHWPDNPLEARPTRRTKSRGK